MCRRMVTACVECGTELKELFPCSKWYQREDRNIFGSGWMRDHVKEDKGNLTNSVKFSFCIGCKKTVSVSDRYEIEEMYKKKVVRMFSDMEKHMIGVLSMRVIFPGFVIFL